MSPHSRSSAIDAFEAVSKRLKSLPVSSPMSTFLGILEQLKKNQAKGNQWDVVANSDIMNKLQSGQGQFIQVLRRSEEECRRSYEFTDKMIRILDLLLDNNANDVKTLQFLITEMQTQAREMQTHADDIVEKCLDASKNLIETGAQVPYFLEHLIQKHQLTANKRKSAEKRSTPMKLMKAGVTAAAGVVGVIGGISTVAFPPALLVLPVILPLLLFLADFLELKNTKLIKELKIEEQELHGAIVKLKEASESLNVMTGHVDDCTNFWMGIELNLDSISGRLAELNAVNDRPRLINAKRTLKEAKAEYKKYYTELKKLRTLYTPTIGAARDVEDHSSEEAISMTSSATSSQSGLTRRNATKSSGTSRTSTSRSTLMLSESSTASHCVRSRRS